MFAKSRARQWKARRFIEALLIAVAGCALTTGSALAQSCDGASGGTVTVSSSNLCSTITLSNGTNLQVTNTGSMTNIFSGTGAGNITIDGAVARTGGGSAIGGSGSIGSLTLGPGSTVSATGAVYAIDYRLVSTLASFTNNGAVSSSTSGFATRNSTVNGGIVNNGTFSTFSRAIEMASSTINGDVTNSATGTITTTSTGNISGSGIILNGSRVTGNVTNAGRMYGQDGGTTYGFLISNNTNVDGSFINSGTISGTTSLYNHGAFIQNATFGGTVTNTTTGIINTAGRGLFLASVTASALQNLGSITTGGEGIRVDGSTLGSLLNSGSITTTGVGSTGIISSNVTYNGAVTNSGSISSLATGMSLSGGAVRGDVTNTATGTITTTATAGTNLGIFSSAAITGSLINDGSITGGGGIGSGRAGISTSGGSIGGNLANNGTIGGYTTGVALSATAITGNVVNSGSGVITATGVGVSLSGGTVGSLLNSGAIATTGTASENNGIYLLDGARVTGDLANSGLISGQAGAGSAKTAGIRLSTATLGGSLVNSGTIQGYNYGLRLGSAPVTGSVTNSGTITSVDDGVLSRSSVTGGVQNLAGGTITAGGYGFNLDDFNASYGSILNAGTMTTALSGVRANAVTINGDVLNTGAITTTGTAATSNGIELQTASVTGALTNSGTMRGQAGTGGAITTGVLVSGGSIAGGIRNSGGIVGYNDGVALSGTTLGGAIDNLGSVNAERYGYNLADAGAIAAFNNFGAIAAGMAGVTATGSTQIQNLTNAQGVGNSAGPLTYSGTLPTNYFIVINGSSYGQLGVDPANHSGQMTFAISPLSNGVAPRTYSTVLTGVSSADLTNPDSVQARFGDRGKLVLRRQGGSATTWDLALEGYWNPFIGYNNPNVGSTYQAMNANRLATLGVLHQRYAVLNAVSQYDCDRFERNNVCIQFQNRETGFGAQAMGAGVLNAAYRFAERFRFGAYLDYQTWARTPFGVTPAGGGVQQGYNNATYGGYVGYSENDDQTGVQARASGGYNQGQVNIVRAFLAGSEPGFGFAGLNAYYAYGVVGYGVKSAGMTVTPYGGVQYTSVTREAYTETMAPATLFPLTYNAYYERLITGLAGVKISGMFNEAFGYQASLGGQFDLGRNASDFGGFSLAPGMETFGMIHGGSWNGVRPSAMAGLSYAPLPNHRLSLNGYANQQAWTTRTYVSGLLGYQIGF